MTSKFLFVTIVIYLFSQSAFSAQYKQTSSHFYTIIPFHELHQTERLKVIEDSHKVLIEELERFLPENTVTRTAMEVLSNNTDNFAELVHDLNVYVDEKVQEHESLQSIYSAHDMIPSAFMILVGGKVSLNFKVGGGGSATFAVVVVPSKIIKTNKITRVTEEYYSLRAGIAVFPIVNIGGGFGGGAAVRAGVGLVWGDLTDPEDFYGTSIGVSGSLAYGVGNNFKIGALIGFTGIKNIYATGAWQVGAIAEAAAHINIGAVVPVTDFIKTINVATGEEADPVTVLGAE